MNPAASKEVMRSWMMWTVASSANMPPEDEGAGSYGVMEYILSGEATVGPQSKQG